MKKRIIGSSLFKVCTTLGVGLWFFLHPLPAQAIPTPTPKVWLDVMDSDIYVGGTFDVEVWVDGEGIWNDLDDIHDELLSFGFDVNTPGTYFSYTGYTLGSGFDEAWFPSLNVEGITLSGITDDDVLLAILSFSADDIGTDSLTVFGSALDFFGLGYWSNGFFDIDASTSITVNAAPIPEPSTLFLLGIGLLAFVVLRRKFLVRHGG